jgi:outer membrane protein assembly factor BamB
MRRLLAICAVLLVAADWPQWLGPNRDGTSTEVVRPWTGAPKVVWRVPVGDGHSSPVVAGGRVYLHQKVADQDAEKLVAYDAATGREVAAAVHPRKPFASKFGVGPRATPVVTPDGQVISYGVTGNLAAEAFGGPVPKGWTANPVEQFKAPALTFGVSASPLVDGDRVVVAVGATGASLVAYDRKTGGVAWRALDDPASYASPVIIEHGGRRMLVALTGANVVALDPATGGPHWKFPFRDVLSESSTTPVKVGDLLIASSVTLGGVGLKLTAKDGKPAVEHVWKNPQLNCYFSTPVAVGADHIYMVTGNLAAMMRRGGQPQVDLCCAEVATGKVMWKREKVGKYHAALLRTGDNKLLMHSDSGELAMLAPNPQEYRELARAKVCGETWAHPALADGRLYVRDDKELICLQLGE